MESGRLPVISAESPGILVSTPVFVTAVLVAVISALIFVFTSSQKRKRIPPGPPAWPIMGNLFDLGRDPHLSLTNLAKKYGSIYRIWFSTDLCVVLNDYESIKKALSNDAYSGRMKGTIIDFFTQGKGLIMSDGDLWKEHRRFALSTLRDLGMGKSWLQERVLEEIQLVLDVLKSQNSQPYDPEHLVTCGVSNIICVAVFGKRFAHDDKDFEKLLKLLRDSIKQFGQSNLLVLFPALRFFPYFRGKFARMQREDDIFFDFIGKMIDNARRPVEALDEGATDYVNAFLQEGNKQVEARKGTTFDAKQLKISVGNMFVAGTETTSSTVLIGLLHMIENPDILSKFQAELDGVVRRDELVRMEHRAQLPFAEATILELLRVAAVAPLGVFHRTTEKTTLDKYEIPENTLIISNIYAVHHDPLVWGSPDKFDPTRFLDTNGRFVKSPYVISFAVGKRACLGESLAMMELFLVFTNILHAFDLIVPNGANLSSKNIHVAVTISPYPYELIFRPRVI